MDKSPIEIYNSPEVADLWRMKKECHEYYANCLNRFKCGEQFYPHGFARTDYSTIAQLLVRTLYSLSNKDVLSQGGKYVLRLHFNKHFEYVPVWSADWSLQYYLPNSWELWKPFHVHTVEAVNCQIVEGRKQRFAVLAKGDEIPMDSAFFLRQPRQCYMEQALPDKMYRNDWQLALNREIAIYYGQANSTPVQNSRVLTFPRRPK